MQNVQNVMNSMDGEKPLMKFVKNVQIIVTIIILQVIVELKKKTSFVINASKISKTILWLIMNKQIIMLKKELVKYVTEVA